MSWDGKTISEWGQEVDGADVVINLAGRSVNCRYTAENRKQIMDSRVDSTKVVGDSISAAKKPPSLWLQMSTATIYSHRFDAANDETTGIIGGTEPDAPPQWRFSISVAQAWERTLDEAPTPSTRKVKLRTSIVMSPDRGGPFDTLLTLVRLGLGGQNGSGRQYISWITDLDFFRAIEFIIANQNINGVVNLATPNPIPNEEFMSILRNQWGTRVGLPSAMWMLSIGALVLQTETELILKSRRVVPGVLLAENFKFELPQWACAAHQLCERWRQLRSARS